MTRLAKEIKESIFDDIVKLSMIFLQLLLFFTVCMSSFISYYDIKQQKEKFNNTYGEKQFLRITENFYDGEYEEFLSNPNYLGKMKSVYNKLINNEIIGYLPEYTNPVYLADLPKDERFLYHSYGSTETNEGIELESWDKKTDLYYDVNAVWTGKGVLETYGLIPESGRFFTDDDFVPIHSGDTVPIILGADYKEYFEIGDHIKGDIFIANVQFEIIGFLEKGAAIKVIDSGRAEFKALDSFAVIPLPDHPNTIDAADIEAQTFIYGLKICGFSYTDKTPDIIQSEINKICNEVGFEPKLQVQSATNYEDTELMMDMNALTDIAFALSAILVLFSVMTFSLTMVNNIRNKMRYYAILMTNGFTYSDITKIILAAPIFVETAALISGGIVLFVIGGSKYISLLLIGMLFSSIIAVLIFAVISVVTLREFKCHDLANYLRKK